MEYVPTYAILMCITSEDSLARRQQLQGPVTSAVADVPCL